MLTTLLVFGNIGRFEQINEGGKNGRILRVHLTLGSCLANSETRSRETELSRQPTRVIQTRVKELLGRKRSVAPFGAGIRGALFTRGISSIRRLSMDNSILWLLPGAVITVVFAVRVLLPPRGKNAASLKELQEQWVTYLERSQQTLNTGVLAVALVLLGWLMAIVTSWR